MDHHNSPRTRLSWILGALVMAALLLFVVTGGHLGGTAKVEGDGDLPPVTSPRTPGSGNVGSR